MPDTDLCLSLAAYGLAGAVVEFPDEPLDRSSWQRLRNAAFNHQLDGLLAAVVADRALATKEGQREAVEEFHADRMSACLTLEAALVGLADSLERAGIPVLVLRGPSTAHLDYPNPALRPFADIDLLVPAGMMEKAGGALVLSGLRKAARPKHNETWEAPALTLVVRQELEVDVYEHVIGGPLAGTIPATQLWSDPSSFELAGTTLSALSPEARLVAACLRVTVGPAPRLIALRDVVQLVLGGQVEAGRLYSLARQWGVQAVVARGVRQAWESFSLADVLALSTWARRHRPTAEDAALFDAYRQAAFDNKGRPGRSRRLLLPAGTRASRRAGALFR
jgi:hypothetical protein